MFDKNKPYNSLPLLPGKFDYEQKEILKLTIKASESISKLNGLLYLVPNLEVLISPLLTKESVESSAIENIHTTTVKVLQSQAIGSKNIAGPEKEVLSYHSAVLEGLNELKKYGGLGYNSFINIQKIIEPNKEGVRKISGTLISDGDGNAVYTPPEGKDNIDRLLKNLEDFMNDSTDDINALIKMPVLHYQFESIHPFYDGNGRTGRILNVLYLVLTKKLDFPVLFLSEYINKNKSDYYNLLNKTSQTGDYTDFIIYMLNGVIEQAKNTGEKILKINKLMDVTERKLGKLNIDYHKINIVLFTYPFLTLKQLETELNVSNRTILRYVETLEKSRIISSVKVGRNKLLYIKEFIDLLS